MIVARVCLLFASSLLALLIMEATVRLLDIPPRPLERLPIASYQLSDNPVIGYEYRKNYRPSDEPFDESHRGYAINPAGFRDHEYPVAKKTGTFRIIALGDSTTAGNGVADLDKTFTKILERRLNENNDGVIYEVLNMGVGGYHTMQEVETLRVKGLQYQPDHVILTLCLNDLDINADGNVTEELRKINVIEPWYEGQGILRAVMERSRLAFVLYHRLRLSTSGQRHEEWYRQEVLKGKSTVEAGLSGLDELQRDNGFESTIFVLPDFRAPFDAYRSHRVHEEIHRAAEGLSGIILVDLLEPFSDLSSEARVFSDDGCHLNEHGHEVMAGFVHSALAGILPGQESSGAD